jgi:hypothetical protein
MTNTSSILRLFALMFFFSLPLSGQNTSEELIVSGHVFDEQSGEVLIAANIYDSTKTHFTTTNAYGFFSLTLPKGTSSVIVSYLGYQNTTLDISQENSSLLKINLKPGQTNLDEVTVTANESLLGGVSEISHTITAEQMTRVPVIFAEPDIQQMLLSTAGVNSVGDGTTGFNVRGGKVDQNLILVDEAPLYNTAHLFGFISVVNTDAIKKIDFYKSGIPAKYGGRASSIVEIRLKEGNQRNFEGTAAINPILTKLSLQVPLIKDKLNIMFSGRISFLDFVLPLFAPDDEGGQIPNVGFFDTTFKMNYRMSEKNKLFFSYYNGKDNIDVSDAIDEQSNSELPEVKFKWGDALATLRWNHVFSDRIFSNLSLIKSEYQFNFKSSGPISLTNSRDEISSSFEGWEGKYDLSFFLTPKWSYYTGFGSKLNTYTRLNRNEASRKVIPPKDHGLEYYAYLETKAKLGEKTDLRLGLRFSGLWNHGPNFSYTYDPNFPKSDKTVIKVESIAANKTVAHYQNLEPRFSIRYRWNEKYAFNFAYDRMVQYSHLLTNTQGIAPLDTWTISNKDIPPTLSDQWNLGGSYRINQWNFTTDFYFKNQKNNVVFRENANIFLIDKAEALLVPASSTQYGMEISATRKTNRLNAHFNYTWSRSLLKTNSKWNENQINKGEYYPANYDRPHKLNVLLGYDISPRIQLNSKFIFQSGRPITLPTGRINNLILYAKRNGFRLPDYHRLDLSMVINGNPKKTKKIRGQWVISILNVYARKNPFSYFLNSENSHSENNRYQLKQLSVFGTVVPTFSYNVKF